MKRRIIFSFIILSFCIANAQVRPEAYISTLPEVPGNICDEETSGKDEFLSKVNEVDEILQNELARRNKNMDDKLVANESKMEENAMKQTGISPELMQQMMALEKANKGTSGETKKAYEAQKKALADQMIQEKMNISMGEIENLKKMDKAGQTAWATAYATEMKADVMADPKKYQDQNAENMQKLELLNKQKQLTDSLGAAQNKYFTKLQELEADDQAKKLLANINRLSKEIYDLYTEAAKHETSPDSKKLIALTNERRTAKISYCSYQSPKYIDILAQYKSFVRSSLPAYYHLEKLTNQVYKSQTGVDLQPEPGEMGLGAVGSYIGLLKGAYKYNLLGAEDILVGYGQ